MMDPALTAFLIDGGKASIDIQDSEYFPTLLVSLPDDRVEMMVLAGGAHPYNMLIALLPTLRAMHPVALGLTVDSYIIQGHLDHVEDMNAIRARYNNSLQAAFEAGEPTVTEALVINMATPTEVQVITMPYARTSEGIVWGKQHDDTAETSGRMIDVLQAVWR